jgi:FMN-dependent NADH-azoreductase
MKTSQIFRFSIRPFNDGMGAMDTTRNLLLLTSSLHGRDGASSRLARAYVDRLRAADAGVRVVERDLARSPVPHLTAERFAALTTPPDARTPAQRAIAAEADALVAELRAADTIALGLPMYNFGVPSTLKAYFDHVARAGVTFRYTASGPQGLLQGTRAVVFAARGGRYADTPRDTQTVYVRDFLGFVGIDDVTFVHAEGLALGDAPRAAALAAANAAIERLVPLPVAA